MSKRLENQVVIVTGGADGIGDAIVRLFAREGARVCIADIDQEKGETLAAALTADGHDAVFANTDVTQPDSVSRMVATTVDRLGTPTVLVNNAGIIRVAPDPLAVSDHDWRQSFAVNLDGMWHCCREVMPHMIEQGRGAVVNLASVHSFRIVRGHFPYAVTKHAVIGLTRNLAVEYAPHNVRVNALCPGMIETPMAFKVWAESDDPAAARAAVADLHPMGRNGSTQEAAKPALFLASDDSSFMTGQTIIVDGGRSALYHR